MEKTKNVNIVQTVIRLLLVALGAITFIIFAFPLRLKIINAGNLFGFIVAAVLICTGIFLPKIKELIKKICTKRSGKGILIGLLCIIIAGMVLFFGTLGSIISAGITDADTQQTVIVLGCKVRGTKPGVLLLQRTQAAADYLKEHPTAVAILSGGQGKDEQISEAQCMYNIMIDEGIDPSRIYIEDKSTSTDENIAFSKKIIEDNDLSNDIAVSTSNFHQKRARIICKKNGLNAASISCPTSKYYEPTYYVREVFGVWVQWLEYI